MEWHKLKVENPCETPESCLERLRIKAGSTDNASATSAAPRVTPIDDDGKVIGSGRESVAASSTKVGEKRKRKQEGTKTKTQNCRVKVEVDDRVTDAEAKQLVREMHARVLDLVNSKLPFVVKGLYSQKKEWKVFKKRNGGDFSKRSLLTLLMNANGKQPRLLYDDKVKTLLVEQHTRFYRAFPTFEVLRPRMLALRLEWPEWWQ